MCSLIVQDQPKFRSNSFIPTKVIQEKHEGGLAQPSPPLVWEGLNQVVLRYKAVLILPIYFHNEQ